MSRVELDVLALVVADRDLGGVVQQDVGDHEHRVVEEADATPTPAGVALLGDFSLNWVMRRSSPNVATQLSNHVSSAWARTWLCTNSSDRSPSRPAAISIVASVPGRRRELGRVPRHGQRVEVDDAEDRLVVAGCGAIRPAGWSSTQRRTAPR